MGYKFLKRKNLITKTEAEETINNSINNTDSIETCSIEEKIFIKKYGPSFFGGLFGAFLISILLKENN